MKPFGELPPLLDRLAIAAERLGMLKRRFDPAVVGGYSAFLIEAVADELESLDMMLRPTAGELVSWYDDPCDEVVEAALANVDAERDRFRRLLGRKAA